eukprot:7190565-Heterocapsa_arctica.AAC.1
MFRTTSQEGLPGSSGLRPDPTRKVKPVEALEASDSRGQGPMTNRAEGRKGSSRGTSPQRPRVDATKGKRGRQRTAVGPPRGLFRRPPPLWKEVEKDGRSQAERPPPVLTDSRTR